jgi:hypothetical protein
VNTRFPKWEIPPYPTLLTMAMPGAKYMWGHVHIGLLDYFTKKRISN